jgi:hypothetical protein
MNTDWKKIPKIIGTTIFVAFAIIGFGLTTVYFAVRFGLTNSSGIIDNQRQSFLNNTNETANVNSVKSENLWQTSPEWSTLKEAILKDQGVINRASATAGIPARLIVENLVAEQMRFFYDDRESYKKFFAPLKILGSQTKFSWGVMGIKEETALLIEKNLKDRTSPFYIGKQYENLLDFSPSPRVTLGEERFTRITDQHDHYYGYLYTGLYLHQIIQQWKSTGFDISNRPDVLATLFNIGFANSHPNANPQSGGALIPIDTQTWSFGSLAKSFYDSNELLNEFPR